MVVKGEEHNVIYSVSDIWCIRRSQLAVTDAKIMPLLILYRRKYQMRWPKLIDSKRGVEDAGEPNHEVKWKDKSLWIKCTI